MLESLKNRYLSILPAGESFFYATAIEEGKRFEKEILHLNFAHISPYKSFDILPFYEKGRVLLWFYPASFEPNVFVIPQTYLLYLYAKSQDSDAIFIVQESIDRMLVIKEGLLVTSYCGYNLQDQQEILLDEYGVENIYLLSASKAQALEAQSLAAYPLLSYYQWYQSQTSFKEYVLIYLERAVVPIAIVIGVFILLELARDYAVEEYYSNLQEEYKQIKKQNDPYRKELKSIKKDIAFTRDFYNDILIYPNSIDIMEKLFSIVAKDANNTIKNLQLSGDKLSVQVETFDAISILNEALKSGYFKEFKVRSSRKLRKTQKEIVYYDGVLKSLKDRDGE